MKGIFGASWSRNLVAALLAAILFTLLGLIVGTSPNVTIFAAAIFGALLILIVQIGEVIQILWASRNTPHDMGAEMIAEVETPAGQQEIKKMSFGSLLTVAIVQELYLTLFKRDRPLWAFEFLGMAEDMFAPRDYGMINRYLEWALMILTGAVTLVSGFLMASFAYHLTPPGQAGPMTLVGAGLAFLLGVLVAFPLILFIASVIRRMFVLYSTRANVVKIDD